MSNQNREEQERVEEPAQELNDEYEALLHFSRYSEARAGLPWNQRTFKEKFGHYIDRIFLLFLAVFLLVLACEVIYKVWYVSNWQKMYMFVLDIFSYLITEEDKEELKGL